jgi:hypothetical protein
LTPRRFHGELASMRTVMVMAVVAGAFGGCGGSEGDPLVGQWDLTDSNGCLRGLTITAGNAYEGDLICTLTDGTVGLDAELGAYSTSGNAITFNPSRASCADAVTNTFNWSLNQNQLSIIGTNGVLVFQKTAPSNGNGSAVFGCYEADGLFHQMPLAPVP